MQNIKPFLTNPDVTVKAAWQQLNDNGHKILFVVDAEERLIGSVTDGDVRRWILDDHPLSDPIQNAMCTNPIVVDEVENPGQVKKKLLDHRIDCLPVVNRDRVVTRVLFWDELFKEETFIPDEKINLPVVIMAGGRGERLDPFTKILPKPLMPIGEKPFIQLIMESFGRCGIQEFILTLNYKSSMIKAYFQDWNHPYQIQFLHETIPLGTAGSLSLLAKSIRSTFIVSNANILVDMNYADMLRHHREHRNQLTLVCSMKHFPIPYGVVEIENGGTLKGISEKPEFDHLVLTGLYVVEPELIRMIPPNQDFGMTQLIEKAKAEGQKIGVYPVSDKSWMDIGELEAYQKTLKRFQSKESSINSEETS